MADTSLFKNTAFTRVLLGSTASGFATWGLIFLLGLEVAQGRFAADALGIALGIRTVGFLIGVFVGGVLADRFSRRKVILFASLVAALGIVLMMFGMTALLYAGAVLSGLGQGACRPAYQALVPMTVETSQLRAANAWMSLSVRLVILAGPTLTSALVLWTGSLPAYVSLFLIWLVSAFCPPWLPAQVAVSDSAGSAWRKIGADLLGGVAEARRHPWFVYSLLALTLMVAFGYSATQVLMPQIAAHTGNATLMTTTLTAYALGAIVAAAALGRWQPKPRGVWALLGLAAYGFAPLSLLLPDRIGLVAAGYFVAGVGIELFNVMWFTAIQEEVPKSHLARVSSLDFLCSYGLAPLGLSLIAPLAEHLGVDTVLWLCAAVCLVLPLLVLLEKSSGQYRRIKT